MAISARQPATGATASPFSYARVDCSRPSEAIGGDDNSTDGIEEDIHVEGLGDDLAAVALPRDRMLVKDGVIGGADNDRDRAHGWVGSDLVEDVHRVPIRPKPRINDHGIGQSLMDDLRRLGDRGTGERYEVCIREQLGNDHPASRIGIDHKHPSTRSRRTDTVPRHTIVTGPCRVVLKLVVSTVCERVPPGIGVE